MVQQQHFTTFDKAVSNEVLPARVDCTRCEGKATYSPSPEEAYCCPDCGRAQSVVYQAEKVTGIPYAPDATGNMIPSVKAMACKLAAMTLSAPQDQGTEWFKVTIKRPALIDARQFRKDQGAFARKLNGRWLVVNPNPSQPAAQLVTLADAQRGLKSVRNGDRPVFATAQQAADCDDVAARFSYV